MNDNYNIKALVDFMDDGGGDNRMVFVFGCCIVANVATVDTGANISLMVKP